MIWYELPAIISTSMFLALLLLTVCQTVIALEAGELLHAKRALCFIRLLYGLLAVISAVLSWEGITAIASVEGGIYLTIPGLLRYTAILPALLYLYSIKRPAELPQQLQPPIVTFFIPLLFLPSLDRLPMPLPVAFTVFAVVWLMLDIVRMLLSFRTYARMEVTRGVIAYIIHGISHGICIVSRRGWILETNPAFISLCESLGIHKAERIDEFDVALRALHDAGRLQISGLESGKSIKADNGVYFLQRNSFKARGKTFIQIALSDVTEITRAASELERENERLAQNNQRLESLISDIKLEETIRERERLCRAAHDLWSQRLAVAGLSIDILLERKNRQINGNMLKEIAEALKEPIIAEHAQTICDLSEILRWLIDMYKRLGVEIQIGGQADFTECEQAAMCAVFREAVANAVRHAYARYITIRFYEDSEKTVVLILNDCLDDKPDIVEGRGLHDIKKRIFHAGGTVQYKKGTTFELEIIFPKGMIKQEEALA